MADLGGRTLGLADPGADSVVLDSSAAGHGWFVDPTPASDEEFAVGAPGSPLVALPGSAAAGKEDLLSAVLHEMGHLAGKADTDARSRPDDLMADMLPAGTRRIAALDQIFGAGG